MAFTFDFSVMQMTQPVAGTPVAVRVDWIFYDEVPPLVEIYWRGSSSGGDPWGPFRFATVDKKSGSGSVQIPAGTVVRIGVCPRQVDTNGSTLARTTQRRSDAVHWDYFLLWKEVAIVATEPKRDPRQAPVITGIAVSKGRIDVDWSHFGCSFFELHFGPAGLLPFTAEVDSDDRTFAVRRVAAGNWRVSVRACWRNRFFGIPIAVDRSDWTAVDVQVPEEQGWQAWTGGVPGGAVAVGWQQATGQPLVLHVAHDGRPHVTWPLDFGGWQEPAPIGPADIVPKGGGIAVAQQAPSVVTAIAIGMNKRLTTWHVNDTQVWIGPGEFGPADFPPGGAVTLGKQTDDRTVAAAVDYSGAVQIAWVEGTKDWHDPVSISAENFTLPGASVALARLADDLLALLVVAADGALHIAWVDGTGGWKPLVPISKPALFDPMTGLGFSAQGMDIGVALAMSKEGIPLVSFSQAKGPWSPPLWIRPAGQSPRVCGLGLGRTSFDTLAAVWADETGELIVAGVSTGSPWTTSVNINLPKVNALPGGGFGMSGGVAAFVDKSGRLAILRIQGVGTVDSGPVLA